MEYLRLFACIPPHPVGTPFFPSCEHVFERLGKWITACMCDDGSVDDANPTVSSERIVFVSYVFVYEVVPDPTEIRIENSLLSCLKDNSIPITFVLIKKFCKANKAISACVAEYASIHQGSSAVKMTLRYAD